MKETHTHHTSHVRLLQESYGMKSIVSACVYSSKNAFATYMSFMNLDLIKR